MIFSTTFTKAENIMMSCRPSPDLFKYEDNLLLKDKALVRSKGKWISICTEDSRFELVNLEVKDGSAFCIQGRILILGRSATIPEKNACLREKNAPTDLTLNECEANEASGNAWLGSFEDWIDCCRDKFIPTEDMHYYQKHVIYDFIKMEKIVKVILPPPPENKVLLGKNKLGELYVVNEPHGIKNYTFPCDKKL